MKDKINNNQIESVLSSFKANESESLSFMEKQNILNSVFERVDSNIKNEAVKTPFYNYQNYFVQYLKYSIPVILIAVIGTQMVDLFNHRSKVALSDIYEAKNTLDDIKRDSSIKSNLSKNKQDIQELKLALASSEDITKKQILANQVSTRSKEIRNQVAALVSENKIAEAKKIVLDLETALKSDELYTVSTSVEQEVMEAIDLRVDIEKKESENASSTTESDVLNRIDLAKKDLSSFDKNATTTDMILDAENAILTAEKHLENKDLSNAIISLQLYDRIVAEIKLVLLP